MNSSCLDWYSPVTILLLGICLLVVFRSKRSNSHLLSSPPQYCDATIVLSLVVLIMMNLSATAWAVKFSSLSDCIRALHIYWLIPSGSSAAHCFKGSLRQRLAFSGGTIIVPSSHTALSLRFTWHSISSRFHFFFSVNFPLRLLVKILF